MRRCGIGSGGDHKLDARRSFRTFQSIGRLPSFVAGARQLPFPGCSSRFPNEALQSFSNYESRIDYFLFADSGVIYWKKPNRGNLPRIPNLNAQPEISRGRAGLSRGQWMLGDDADGATPGRST